MSQPKNLLKSLNSKPGDLATKFIIIDGKPMMARRSVTGTQPSRVESVKPNVKQPSQHDMKSSFATVFSAEKDDQVQDSAFAPVTIPNQNVHEQSGWEDPKIIAMKQSFVSIVSDEQEMPMLNFITLLSTTHVDKADCVLPVENVMVAQNKFANSLVGFFVGKSMAFQVVQNYVNNTWCKFGFQKVIRDDDDVYYFKFTSVTGMEQDKVTKVPLWVKIHKVPVVAYSADGLSLIGTQIGKPILLDAFTSAMCKDPWERIGYARALIEVSADKYLKKEVTMVIPNVNGEGHTKVTMKVEYEWKPSCCSECHVFGHTLENYPKRVVEPAKLSNVEDEEGFTTVKSRRRKGKKVDNGQPRQIDGLRLNKPKPNYVWNVKTTHTTMPKSKTNSDDGVKIVQLKNTFNALQDQDDVSTVNEKGGPSRIGDDDKGLDNME
ncbi:hypothetical protein Tco_1525787 [Tanacetum coccineum]